MNHIKKDIKKEVTNMNTNIETIGKSFLALAVFRWAAIVFMFWLGMEYVDGWVRGYLQIGIS